MIGNMKLGATGIVIETPTAKRNTWGTLTADERTAKVAVGSGPVGISQVATEGSPIVTWSATGAIESKILINTDTGEWTLVRTRYGAANKVLKEEQRQLLPPLGD